MRPRGDPDPATGDASELHREADRLVQAGAWGEIADRLEEAGLEVVLGNASLAYRYGEALYHAGRMAALLAWASRFEAAAAARADGRGLLGALNLGAIAAFELGRIEEARERSERQLGLAEDESDTDMLARATQNLAAIANLEGRTEEAIADFQLAIPLYERLDRLRGLAQIQHNLGICYRDAGREEDAVDAYREAEELARLASYLPGVAMATVGRAEATTLTGDLELGLRLADRGLELARAAGDPISEAEALRVRARARLRAADSGGGTEDAVDDLARALRLARRTGNSLLQAEIERDAARIRLARGQGERAARCLRRALAGFEALGARAEARRVRELLEKAR